MRAALVIGLCILSNHTWAQRRMENTQINWTTVDATDATTITAVRWLNGKDGPVLVASSLRRGPDGPMDSTLVFSGGAGLRVEMLAARQSLPSQPGWDVAVDAGGAPVFVYTDAGGAINELLLHGARGALPVTTGQPFESFHGPRFVKHAPGLPLIAIQDQKQAVIFKSPGTTDGGHSAILDCETAVALADRDTYHLVYKTGLPGPPRGILILRGALHALELDKGFKVLGKATEPLGGAVVFEYDADLARVGTAILATTVAGTLLKVGDVSRSFNEPFPQSMTSPSVLVAGGRIYMAALERAQTQSARVVMAQLSE
jgi:hypothetical protein